MAIRCTDGGVDTRITSDGTTRITHEVTFTIPAPLTLISVLNAPNFTASGQETFTIPTLTLTATINQPNFIVPDKKVSTFAPTRVIQDTSRTFVQLMRL